jgi:acyl dehydratase
LLANGCYSRRISQELVVSKAYFKSCAIGDLITPLVKSAITRVHFAKFAAATKDYNPLHLDDDFARMNGYGGAFAPGNLTLAFLEEALYNFADNGRLIRLLGTFHKMVWPGDLLTSKALISDKYKHNGEHRIDLEIWIENQYHDIIVKGQATYVLFESAKDEAQSNQPLPALSEASKAETNQMIRAKLAALKWRENVEETRHALHGAQAATLTDKRPTKKKNAG